MRSGKRDNHFLSYFFAETRKISFLAMIPPHTHGKNERLSFLVQEKKSVLTVSKQTSERMVARALLLCIGVALVVARGPHTTVV